MSTRSHSRHDPLPAGAEKVRAVESMFDRIAPRYELLNRVLTFGLDRRWRKRAVGELGLAPGACVLDLACGTGDLCRQAEAAGLFTVGFDRSAGMLERARTTAPLVRGDALALPLADAVADGVLCGFALRNFTGLEPFFAECARVLKPGGRVALIEVSSPEHSVVRAGHNFYFSRVVPLVGGLLSDRSAYRYLPRSVAYLPSDGELVTLLASAGFADAHRVGLSGGIAQLLVGTRS